MATNSKKSHDEDETSDATGRKHDGRGRFVADDESETRRSGGQGSRGGQGQGGQAQGGQGQGAAAQKRVLSRAARVLNEIEARIHELREELEEQSGQSSGGESGSNGSGNGSGRGQVKHPETDGRLKQNRADSESDDDETEEGEDTSGRNRTGGRR